MMGFQNSSGAGLPESERREEVREHADGRVEAVRQTTTRDAEGRAATVNEQRMYVSAQ